MNIRVREHIIHIHIIELTGRLDAFTVTELRTEQQQLLDENSKNFIVDLSQVEFIDSSGMAALVSLLKSARQAGGNVVLVKPTDPAAYRILTLTRFDQVFSMADSTDTAIKQI